MCRSFVLKMIMLLLAFGGITTSTFSAGSQWEPFGDTEDATWYVLKDSKKYSDGIATFWMLMDLKESRKLRVVGMNSVVQQYQLHCADHKAKIIYYKSYSKQMGLGEMIIDSDLSRANATSTVLLPSEWEDRGYAKLCKKQWEFWK